MNRRIRRFSVGLLAVLLAAGLAVIWMLSPEAERTARFAHNDCKRVDLTDPRTGQPIVGVEDLVLAPDGNTLILSAHDRVDPDMPDGGLYAVSLMSLLDDANAPVFRLDAVRNVALSETVRFRPHGIAMDPESGALAVINRNKPSSARIEVGPVGPTGWRPDWVIEVPRLCRANDLEFRPDGLFTTIDRADCGPSFRDLAPWSSTGSIARVTPDAVIFDSESLQFPNGLALGTVAETRAHAVRWPGGERLKLPGGPDNLTVDADGALIAAIHPSLIKLFLMREGWFENSPSRIVRITPSSRQIEILFDDPTGRMFSSATVGVLAKGHLIAGSSTDKGILICKGQR